MYIHVYYLFFFLYNGIQKYLDIENGRKDREWNKSYSV